jgi:F0F1-type ATP synthase assembly protein I
LVAEGHPSAVPIQSNSHEANRPFLGTVFFAGVFIGTILGWFVHRYFFGIPAFVGAGLVFAGVTDTCGMGLLLARAPWNQISGDKL